MPPKKAPKIKYDAESYLRMLTLSKRSKNTIASYRKAIMAYARFLGVTFSEVHNYISVDNLLKFAESRKRVTIDGQERDASEAGVKNQLSILRRWFAVNGVKFDTLEYNAVMPKIIKEQNDKPLTLDTLQKMMDLTDPHGRALLSFLVSTGVRANELCNVLLSDVNEDTVHIRNEIAKGGHGGYVFLTREAREYLDLWLKERDQFIKTNRRRAVKLLAGPKPKDGEPDTRKKVELPKNDQRLFATSYSSVQGIFSRLFDKVDGEQGKYHAKCTVHSCRKYFRTTAAQGGMHPDLVTNIMRQTGYLDSTYVRMTTEEKRRIFHEYEASLYITRPDHRLQQGQLSKLEKENADLKERLSKIEALQAERQVERQAAVQHIENMHSLTEKLKKGGLDQELKDLISAEVNRTLELANSVSKAKK